MSALDVIYAALTSQDALRASTPEDVATVVHDALVAADIVTDDAPPQCRSLHGDTSPLTRCAQPRRHTGVHTAAGGASWTDDQAAGELRERL